MASRPSPFLSAVLVIVLGVIRLPADDVPANGANPPPLHVVHGYGLKGLALWLEADHGVTADAQGRVTKLVDRIGNFTLTPPGQGPMIVPKALNGHAVFRFTGNESLYSPDGFSNVLDHAMTFVYVALGKAPPDGEDFPVYLGQNAQPGCNRSLPDYKGRLFFDGQFVGCYGEPVVRNVYQMIGGSINRPRTLATFYRNDKKVLTAGRSPENPTGTFQQLSDGVTLGAAPTNLYGWQGDIAEILVFDRELSPSEMQTLWTALSAKYALKDQPAASP